MSRENIKPNVVGAPTIFIGLGGTGSDIVRGVAEMCREGETENVGFVCLDTNANDLTNIKNSKAQIRFVQTSNTQTVGDYLDYDTDARRRWFPKNSVMYDKTVSEGAGQVRAISRLALNATIKTGKINPLYDAIDDLFRKSGKDLKQALRVVLVSTASGGTGSGIILPISMMIRDYIKYKYPNTALLTRGLILLPETLDSVISSTQEKESQRRNAYATIKELNAFMMKGSGFFEIDDDLKRYKDMRVDYTQPDGTRKSLSLLPMDFCFLMDGQDAEDSTMINFQQYKKLAMQALYEQNIGPMQRNAFSVEDNIIKELSNPGNLGRNRFGGIGASVLRYPYEDIADYIAYGWALDNIGSDGQVGKWGQYDRAYEIKKAEAKKKGLSASESPKRDQVYMDTLDTAKDPFSKDIRNVYLTDVEDTVANFFDELTAHMWETLTGNSIIMSSMSRVAKLSKTIDYSNQDNRGHASENLSALRSYENAIRANAERIATSEAESIFDNETATVNENLKYMVEALLKNNEEIAHPVAARYILYKAKREFEERRDDTKERLATVQKGLKLYSPSASEVAKFDAKYTKGLEESFDALCEAEHDQGTHPTIFEKIGGYEQIYPLFNSYFPDYHKKITTYARLTVEMAAYEKGLEFLTDACAMYERFFESFKEKVSSLLRKRDDLVDIVKFKKGDSVVNVCASREQLEELAKTTSKQSADGAMLDKELNGAIYDAVKSNVRFEREISTMDAVEEDKRVDIFDQIVLEYFRKSVRTNCDILDVNIVQAIALEHRLTERIRTRREMEITQAPGQDKKPVVDHISKEDTERYIKDKIAMATRLAAPGIQRITNEEPREVRCAAYNETLDGMREYTMNKIFEKGMSAQSCNTISKYELHFFIALYNLTPDKLNKFASPAVSETRVKNAGLYHNAYMEYGKHLGPDSTKNMMISTHIDKTWDSIAFMPEMDMGFMKKQMMHIHQSLIYALVYKAIRQRNLSIAAGGKKVFRYENSEERTIDLIVSNGTLCDEFYEILDALYIDASVVEDINLVVKKKTERDLVRNSNYKGTIFADSVEKFELPSVHEGKASLFEIPLAYYNSLPNSQRFSGEIAGLVEAVIETLREEMERYESHDDAKFILCDELKDQFTLLMKNYKQYRELNLKKPAGDNGVIDIIYRKIKNTISETPEPDDYDGMLKVMRDKIQEANNLQPAKKDKAQKVNELQSAEPDKVPEAADSETSEE